MVYVNSKKYACESCIKGHRSSSCHHNDRPLFEIKKKGRPVSQCDKCREARKSRRIHAKCTCESERAASSSSTPLNGVRQKGKRFIPTVPSLPNGLKDALKASSPSSTESSVSKQPVDALLNPCLCEDVYNCKCRLRVGNSSASLETRPRKPVDPAIFSDGLSALALVAAVCSPAVPPILTRPLPTSASSAAGKSPAGRSSSTAYSFPSPPSHDNDKEKTGARPSGISKRKRSARLSPPPDQGISEVKNPISRPFRSIAPALQGTHNSVWPASVPSHRHAPTLPFIPVLSSISGSTTPVDERPAEDADISHCCCGTRCECAGCEIHGPAPEPQPSWVDDPAEASRGPSTSHGPAHVHESNCAEDCPTCIDYEGGIELPPLNNTHGASSGSRTSTPAYLAEFLARAASLPTPPTHIRSSLDPTNVTVYPAGLFDRRRGVSEGARIDEDDERPRAFGLVRIPKLEECCGGRCGCVEDRCDCGDACDGCCMGNEEDADGENNEMTQMQEEPRLSPSISFARRSMEVSSPPVTAADEEPTSSCCMRG